MKKFKKLFAVILSLAMVLGMSMTSFAAPEENTVASIDGTPSASDKVDVKIKGITGNPKITLYQIASAEYGKNGSQGFVQYKWVEANEIDFKQATSGQITDLANALVNGQLRVNGNDNAGTIDGNGVYTANVTPGAYIAVITGASDGSVYNPILLTATYSRTEDADGKAGVELIGGTINASEAKYLNGASAVAKKSEPTINKTITGGATEDNTIKDNKLPEGTNTAGTPKPTENATASVGDRLEYTITPTMPSYPAEARNKKLAVTDRTNKGLTFEFDSLNLYLDYVEGSTALDKTVNDKGVATFTDADGKVIAYAKAATTTDGTSGFDMTFNYDNLIYNNGNTVHVPTIKYNAVVNDKAVVGTDGNTNTTTLYYTNQPNTDSDWDPSDVTVPGGEDVKDKTDKETFYTYQVAFHKVGDANDADKSGLAGAVFGIYSDPSCKDDTLVDVVTTDEHGFAASSKVAAGDYYIKEILAPEGYSLNADIFKVTATWKTATTSISDTTTTVRKYTANKAEAIREEQVGYLSATGVFYKMGTSADIVNALGLVPAYLKSETTTTTAEGTTITESNQVTGIVSGLINMTDSEKVGDIPNTTLASLPSTGGIGTTIFTIGGCLIMVVAAALFFASRRKSAK
ncbi:MAG: LPXTG cell wall anchor domain-containing protein [Dorea sp.]|nr:LPXTG cell wall anchor domain-containing protein [Dorea sp.]